MCVQTLFTQALGQNIIEVWGKQRSKSTSVSGTLQRDFNPQGQGADDMQTVLNGETDAAFAKSSRIDATYFPAPRMRGHESRQTIILMEKMSLIDPATQVPALDLLDLAGFSSATLYTGIAPADIPGTSPFGSLNLTPADPCFPPSEAAEGPFSGSFGVLAGSPFGTSPYLSGGGCHNVSGSTEMAVELRGRQHQSNGRFQYYNDNGTPLNTADDFDDVRANNDTRSRVGSITSHVTSGPWRGRLFATMSDSSRGLPAINNRPPNLARQTQADGLIQPSLTYISEQKSILAAATIIGQHSSQSRQFSDTSASLSSIATSSSQLLTTDRAQAQLALAPHRNLSLTPTASMTNVQIAMCSDCEAISAGASTTSAAFIQGSMSQSFTPAPELDITFKQSSSLWRHLESLGQSESARGISVTTGVTLEVVRLYGQWGYHEELPSLIALVGDGGFLRAPTVTLGREAVQHVELGAGFVPLPRVRAAMAVFQDAMRDQIVFVPASREFWQARNLARSRIRGSTVDVSYRPGQELDLGVQATRLEPLNLTDRDQPRLLIQSPELTVAGTAGVHVDIHSMSWQSRYESESYRDLENTIITGATTIHDIGWQAAFLSAGAQWKLSLKIQNIFDVYRLPIASATNPSDQGVTSYSDRSGQPRPGRSWVVGAEASL